MRIAYIGGCHVAGYPVGADLAFPRLVCLELARFGVAVDDTILQPVPVHHLARMTGFVATSRPDVVILQLGNLETSLTVGSLARRALGLRGVRSEGGFVPDTDGGFSPRPDVRYQRSVRRTVRLATKLALHRAWLSRYVRPGEIAAHMDAAARAVTDACAAPVFLLDPLPCADPLVAKYRREVSHALPTRPQGYRRVVFSSATAVALPPATFADLVHLGAAGHRFVAEQLLQVFDDAFDLRSPA